MTTIGKMSAALAILTAAVVVPLGCASVAPQQTSEPDSTPGAGASLVVTQDQPSGRITIARRGHESVPLVTQVAGADERPYLHPIAAPDGKGVLTEVSPAHHPHQTGLYWGFTRVNGRDYFHNRGAEYWRRVSATVLQAAGDEVRWQTVYDLLDEAGAPVMRTTERWAMRERGGRVELDLTWRGEAQVDVTIGKYDYGGLFLRMPWREGITGEVVNAARQRNARAEGQRAMWIDVGMQVPGRDDLAHVAIFEHPDNMNYPQAWRVDDQLGVGSARTRTADWTIPRNHTEVIRHRLLVYTGTLDDVAMTSAWSEFSGNRSTYATSALWGIAQKEGREAKFLTPDQAVAAMTVMDGYHVSAWASEPMIVQPMAFCWDDRGRLWIAENRDYETRGTGFSNDGTSRILILEDTNHDGTADKRTVFLEGIPFPSAIAVGFDGLFLGAPPNLLFVPDRNHDDRADAADIEVRLTGWGIRDRHETINSLHWGPDGWLYGLQGFATPSKIRKPAGKGRLYRHNEPFPADILEGEGVEINGGVWRYHPTKDIFEVVAHGFSNPWGIDYDAKGQLLISACVIPHLWHVVPGGIYQRQGGQHFNPYVYSDIQTIADHRHRSAHGGARVYQSDAFPASERGRIFMANIHEHAVLSDVLTRQGSGFTARHGDDFLLANNAQWIGFSLEVGPDGALYVLDWHDADICGQDVLQKETGRVFRIAPVRSLAEDWPGRYADLSAFSDAQLVGLQTSRSDWHARRARLILQNRAAKRALAADTHERLRALFRSPEADVRLRAMWALHVTGGWTSDSLLGVLGDTDEYIRAWAVQLLCESRAPSPAALQAFGRMAREDPSAVVRLYLASALQRIDPGVRWPIAEGLAAHAEDRGDHNLPIMIWLGMEPLVPQNPALALERAAAGHIPLLARFTARRAVDADALDAVVSAVGRGGALQVSLLEGLRDGLEGRVDLTAPAGWPSLYSRLQRAGDPTARVAREIAQQFGDTEAARGNIALVRNRGAATGARRRALQLLTAQRRPELAAELPRAIDDPAVRLDAIRAVAAFDSDALGTLLINRFRSFSAAERAEAVQTLVARPRYGRMLAEAIAQKTISRGDIPPYAARQLLRVVGVKFLEVWGPIEREAATEREYARYRAVLSERALAAANVQRGHALFLRTCAPCHRLHEEGGNVGPDLTGSNRTNVEYLLLNLLDPNGEVQDAYRMVVVTTRDGRTFSGNVVGESDRQIVLRVVGSGNVTIPKADIQSRETTNASMMPPGLLDALTDSEVVDLVGYLRAPSPATQR